MELSALLGGVRWVPLVHRCFPCVGAASALVPPGEVALAEEEDRVTVVVLGLFGLVLLMFWVWLSDIRQNLDRTKQEIKQVRADLAQIRQLAQLLERTP